MKTIYTFLILSLFAVGATAQNVNIPDANFKKLLLDQNTPIDSNQDGEISYAEAKAVTGKLTISNYGKYNTPTAAIITDLTGIEAFVNITELDCSWNRITKLDLSKNTLLTKVDCNNNALTSVNVRQNTALTWLNCSHNVELTSLDISNNTALTYLDCSSNWKLASLDVSNNSALTYLNCGNMPALTSLDASKNIALTELHCEDTNITNLDVTHNTALEKLWCYQHWYDAKLSSLDISKNTALKELLCGGHNLTSLNTNNNPELWRLECSSNKITRLDLSKNPKLFILYCDSNQLTSLDLSKHTELGDVMCQNNSITSLDLSKNNRLKRVYAYNNKLTYLNLATGNNAVMYDDGVNATNNPLLTCITIDQGFAPKINWKKDATAQWNNSGIPCTPIYVNIPDANFKNYLVNNAAINTNGDGEISYAEAKAFTGRILAGSYNISDLTGIEAFVNLTELDCSFNNITTLDVTKNTALTSLECIQTQITSLDVSQNKALEYLYCYSTQLTSLDVSKNTSLKILDCWNNSNLTSLNVANGNNANISRVTANTNPQLTCITVDKGFTAPSTWKKDATAQYNNTGTPCEILATGEVSNKGKLRIINPVKDQLIITGDERISQIEIYNMSGQKVKTLAAGQTNVSSLAKGIYVVRIITSQNNYSYKIIKE